MREGEFQPLSADGVRRRDAILSDVLRATARVRRRRRQRRALVMGVAPATAILLAIAAALHVAHQRPDRPSAPLVAVPSDSTAARPLPKPLVGLAEARPTEIVSATRSAIIRITGDDPTVERRYRAPQVAGHVMHLDDRQLLQTLDDSGLTAGLATVGDTPILFVDGRAVR